MIFSRFSWFVKIKKAVLPEEVNSHRRLIPFTPFQSPSALHWPGGRGGGAEIARVEDLGAKRQLGLVKHVCGGRSDSPVWKRTRSKNLLKQTKKQHCYPRILAHRPALTCKRQTASACRPIDVWRLGVWPLILGVWTQRVSLDLASWCLPKFVKSKVCVLWRTRCYEV